MTNDISMHMVAEIMGSGSGLNIEWFEDIYPIYDFENYWF